jgi:hypothetical protein
MNTGSMLKTIPQLSVDDLTVYVTNWWWRMCFTMADGVAKWWLLRILTLVGSTLPLDTILSQLHPHDHGTWQSIVQNSCLIFRCVWVQILSRRPRDSEGFVVFFYATQACIGMVPEFAPRPRACLLSCLCQFFSTNRRAMWCELPIPSLNKELQMQANVILGLPRRNEFLR